MFAPQRLRSFIASFVMAVVMGVSLAQKLPAPSRTVFKCESGGKVVYSDTPCLGAQRVDVEPTRGLNKSTGSELVGSDVKKERHNEQMADVLKPVFGESAQQRAKRHARAKLEPDARSTCTRLDREIPAAEQQERSASKATSPAIQAQLLDMRSDYRALRC